MSFLWTNEGEPKVISSRDIVQYATLIKLNAKPLKSEAAIPSLPPIYAESRYTNRRQKIICLSILLMFFILFLILNLIVDGGQQ